MHLSRHKPPVTRSQPKPLHISDALRAHLDLLDCQLRHREPLSAASLHRLLICLEGFPCATGDYSRAVNHLKNAASYLRRREDGAARYELLMLVRELGKIMKDD